MGFLQHSPAHAEDKGAIAAYEHLHSALVVIGQELLQKLAIAQRRFWNAPDQVPDVVQQAIAIVLRHTSSPLIAVPLPITHVGDQEQIRFFRKI